VAEDHKIGIRKASSHAFYAAICLTAVMDHADLETVQVKLQDLRRSPLGHLRQVVVAQHCLDWRIRTQLRQDLCGADVASVQDQIRPSQVLGHRRRAALPASRAVRVGENDNSHASEEPGIQTETSEHVWSSDHSPSNSSLASAAAGKRPSMAATASTADVVGSVIS
jgi:hypothetical protein